MPGCSEPPVNVWERRGSLWAPWGEEGLLQKAETSRNIPWKMSRRWISELNMLPCTGGLALSYRKHPGDHSWRKIICVSRFWGQPGNPFCAGQDCTGGTEALQGCTRDHPNKNLQRCFQEITLGYSPLPTYIQHLKHPLAAALFKQVGSWMLCKHPNHLYTSWAEILVEKMLLVGPPGIC